MTATATDSLPRLFLIRHGNTNWSDSGEHTGRTDIPLNAAGEQHAVLLGSRLNREYFTRIFESPLMRVRRTCELAGFAGRGEVDPDLTEWNYGTYEGRLTVDVHRERPGWYLYRDGAPGGESPEEVAIRADRFIQRVRPMQGDVAAFSSGQIIRVIAARWLGLSPMNAGFFYTQTASINILGYEHDQSHPVVRLWNDVGSLTR
jgi:probable phosphoglycerate mutase